MMRWNAGLMTTYEGTERRYVDLLLVASAICPLG
jgi:hypothetical protein